MRANPSRATTSPSCTWAATASASGTISAMSVTRPRYPVDGGAGATVRFVARLLVIQFGTTRRWSARGAAARAWARARRVALDQGEARPAALDGLGGVIALGGTKHPDQDAEHPRLADVRDLLAEAVDRRIPTLGLCLGGQLLAQALGGRAGPVREPEIGWVDVDLEPAAVGDSLLGALPATLPAFECITTASRRRPPPRCCRTARAPQAFRVGRPDLGPAVPHRGRRGHRAGTGSCSAARSSSPTASTPTRSTARASRAASYLEASHALAAGFASVVERESIASAAR